MWQGFIKESKLLCNYPRCGKWHFWSGFPRATAIFYWLTFVSWIKHARNKKKGERLAHPSSFTTEN